MKNEADFAKVAVEATLLDCSRYFHKAASIDDMAGLPEISAQMPAHASQSTNPLDRAVKPLP